MVHHDFFGWRNERLVSLVLITAPHRCFIFLAISMLHDTPPIFFIVLGCIDYLFFILCWFVFFWYFAAYNMFLFLFAKGGFKHFLLFISIFFFSFSCLYRGLFFV